MTYNSLAYEIDTEKRVLNGYELLTYEDFLNSYTRQKEVNENE